MITKGNCYICGKTIAKTAIKNHILKEHNYGDEKCYLLKAEGEYDKNYWLYFTMPVESILLFADKFLREIWCECCGHMSLFKVGDTWDDDDYGMNERLSSFAIGTILPYEYDFGDTTKLNVTIMSEILRPNQKEKVFLIARNEPHNEMCEKCGKPATVFESESWETLCDRCAENLPADDFLLPLANSPRCGVCGYEGESNDKWVFDSKKLTPQTSSKDKIVSETEMILPSKNVKQTKPPKKISIYSDEYSEYTKKCDAIRKLNEIHLKNFENHLAHKGLTEKTIRNHLVNTEFYINNYLLNYDALDVKQGCHKISSYMDWFMRKTTWASCAEIKANAASFKKFYAFLLEAGTIERNDYDALVETIKEETPYWLEQMKEFDDMLDTY